VGDLTTTFRAINGLTFGLQVLELHSLASTVDFWRLKLHYQQAEQVMPDH
jgi:hypothetical protein